MKNAGAGAGAGAGFSKMPEPGAGAGAKIQKSAEPPEPKAQKYDFWTGFFAKIPQKVVILPERFSTFNFFVPFWKAKT